MQYIHHLTLCLELELLFNTYSWTSKFWDALPSNWLIGFSDALWQIFSSAQQMQNFVYLVGDAKTREAVVVDVAWDVKVSVLLTERIGEWCHNALDH